jgi:Tfp pilus assembly protein FimV
MIAKRSVWALAVLLALPSASFALGLGDIHLLSALNAPLDAQIELQDVSADEINTVQASLASRETFARYGLEWPGYLASVQVRTAHTSDGRAVITLKTVDPISDPFITVLVEVNWSRGHLVREYTMLLDPPIYAPGQSPAPPARSPAIPKPAQRRRLSRSRPRPRRPRPRPSRNRLQTPRPPQATRRLRTLRRPPQAARLARTSCAAARRFHGLPPHPPAGAPTRPRGVAGCSRSTRRIRARSIRT